MFIEALENPLGYRQFIDTPMTDELGAAQPILTWFGERRIKINDKTLPIAKLIELVDKVATVRHTTGEVSGDAPKYSTFYTRIRNLELASKNLVKEASCIAFLCNKIWEWFFPVGSVDSDLTAAAFHRAL